MSPGEAGQPEPRFLTERYDASYYAHYYSAGERVPYERNQQWLGFFAGVADRIRSDIAPATTLDVGCAHGFLVEALTDRGVDANGFDVSEFAISQVRDDVKPKCWVGSVLEPIPGHYDLVTCFEVLEHLEVEDADRAVANLCTITDDILFSSTPTDFREETHVNVRPQEFWAELFARHGFVHDVGFDASFVAWWAVRYRRARDPWYRLAADYEREQWRLRHEAQERNSVVLSQMDQIASELDRIAALELASEEMEALLGSETRISTNGRAGCNGSEPVAAVPLRLKDEPFGLIVILAFLPQKNGLERRDYALCDLISKHAAACISRNASTTVDVRRNDS